MRNAAICSVLRATRNRTMAEEAPKAKKPCVFDLRGEESDDSSVEFTGYAPAPSKSIKTMQEGPEIDAE